jgi:geranylgeranyl diphosphate synthase, type I
MNTLEQFIDQMLPAIEEELQTYIARAGGEGTDEFRQMMAYHLGWEGEGSGAEARGKRIRPLLVLITAASASQSAEWRYALPAAASVELIHNFSLIHDDIEDHSALRRGRRTVWKVWGIPQAINTGDGMFALGQVAILRLSETISHLVALSASQVLQQTCLHLTQGQYLDIAYEGRGDLSLEAYWPMVGGKTAALLSACVQLGALSAQASPLVCESYRMFGWNLGLAFQALDDLLGVWGDAALTGKSKESDLLTGKKSLPVLYGLSQNGAFAQRWREGKFSQAEIPRLAHQLELEGGRAYTQSQADQLTAQALRALEEAMPNEQAGPALKELALKLLRREN